MVKCFLRLPEEGQRHKVARTCGILSREGHGAFWRLCPILKGKEYFECCAAFPTNHGLNQPDVINLIERAKKRLKSGD